MDASDQDAVEGCREGVRAETPKSPLGQVAWKEEATEAMLVFLRDTRVGALSQEGSPRRRSVMGGH